VTRLRITPLRLAAAIGIGLLLTAGVAYAASLGIASKKLHAWSQTLSKGTCSPAESDAEVRANNANRNFGGQSAEQIRYKNNGSNWYVLVGFDLAGSPCSLPTSGGADSAVLTIRVTATTKGPDTISAYPITSAWDASTVTWNTMPTHGSTPDFSFAGAGTYTFTVTAAIDGGIKNGAFYGWMLVDTTGTNNATTTIAGEGSGQNPSIALSYEK
jgi:hypothetical protein